ncbi:Uncharacterised protein [Mycobacteroides abscessus subsp. abscessus]|jgi:hypothetical protein|nr:Uncharacterised protein [Mycobacteroides abscessus subsp. abscessus]
MGDVRDVRGGPLGPGRRVDEDFILAVGDEESRSRLTEPLLDQLRAHPHVQILVAPPEEGLSEFLRSSGDRTRAKTRTRRGDDSGTTARTIGAVGGES